MDVATNFLTANFPYAMEGTILGHAFFGAMVVKGGRNKYGELHWFHAFVLSTVTAFAGGLFNFIWMGKPTSMISNDVVFASCVIAFLVVNAVPLDLGYKLCCFLPVKMVITAFAILFRSNGMVGFVSGAFNTFQDTPSKYYPIPVFGPIWYGIMLGNMGGLFAKGIDGYLAAGIPWPFQNGMFCAPFFHFYAHDTSGPVGEFLRSTMAPVQALFPELDERTFAFACVSLFMQVVAILQMPMFFGPSFSPFAALYNLINSPLNAVLSKDDKLSSTRSRAMEAVAAAKDAGQSVYGGGKGEKKPKRKKKKA